MKVVDTLDFLLGTWRVERLIEDHRSNLRGSFEGTAAVALDQLNRDSSSGVRALYSELGELSWCGYTGLATRVLEYVDSGNVELALNFADGRSFADLDLRTGSWTSPHLCGSDRYELETLVHSNQSMEERWRVTGPVKDYDAVTTFTRLK